MEGGALYLDTYKLASPQTLSLVKTDFRSNVGQSGGAVFVNGILDSENTTLNLVFIETFIENCNASQNGGGIYFSNLNQVSTINLTDFQAFSCFAEKSGGALYIDGTNTDINLQDRVKIQYS